MANIADAYGTIEIRAKSREDIILIGDRLSKAHASIYYSTEFDSPAAMPDSITGNENGYCWQDTFIGDGRWSYATNAEEFLPWACGHIDGNSRCDIEEKDFDIILDYTNIEPGMAVLCTGHAEIHHKAGASLADTYGSVQETNYEWSEKSMKELDIDDDTIKMYFGKET